MNVPRQRASTPPSSSRRITDPAPSVDLPSMSVVTASQGVASLADQAYVQLREAMMSGLFEPGEPIVVQALADQFGTSVMPVREAVARLAAERALEIVSGRSARVPVLQEGKRFIELCEVRKLLEGEAASLAARRATREDLREIERWHQSMQAAMKKHDIDASLRCNRELHFAIYRAAHQELLSQTIEALWLQCGPYFRAVFNSISSPDGRRKQSTRHHQDAIDALRKRDARRAAAAIVQDIEESASWYRKASGMGQSAPDPEAPRKSSARRSRSAR